MPHTTERDEKGDPARRSPEYIVLLSGFTGASGAGEDAATAVEVCAEAQEVRARAAVAGPVRRNCLRFMISTD
jgi:hypothetical protein